MKSQKIIPVFNIIIVLMMIMLFALFVLGRRQAAASVYEENERTKTIKEWEGKNFKQSIIYKNKEYSLGKLSSLYDSLKNEGDKKVAVLKNAHSSNDEKRLALIGLRADIYNAETKKSLLVDSISKAIDNSTDETSTRSEGSTQELDEVNQAIDKYSLKIKYISSGPLNPEMKSVDPLKKDRTNASYASETRYFKITYFVKGCVVPKTPRSVYLSVFDSVNLHEWKRITLKSTKTGEIAYPDATGLPITIDKTGNNEVSVEVFEKLKNSFFLCALSENPKDQFEDFKARKALVPINFRKERQKN